LKEQDINFNMEDAVEKMGAFVSKTVSFTRPFGKMAKKMDGKDPEKQKERSLDFCQKKLRGIWDHTFLKPVFGEKANVLSDEEINTYILGTFITGHSKEFRTKLIPAYKNIIKELSDTIEKKSIGEKNA